LNGRLFLAPLAGVSDKSFRRLCSEQGAALCYTEMVSAKALTYGNRGTRELLEIGGGEGPVGFQLFGSEPSVMAEAVGILEARGGAAGGAALYDVNMGCPVPKVVKNGEGSALMLDPDRAGRIVEAMKRAARAASRPVTAKIRAGWDAARVNCVEVARTLEAAGADAVCVHPRTREQYYGGRADWSLIARVKAAVRIPVIGNGDVFSAADAARMIEETGCDYVMIGRGALGNPWVFAGGAGGVSATTGTGSTTGEAGVPTLQEKTAMFLRHARLVCEDKGERTAVLEMRKHAGWYFKGEKGAAAFRGAMNQAKTMEDLAYNVTTFVSSVMSSAAADSK